MLEKLAFVIDARSLVVLDYGIVRSAVLAGLVGFSFESVDGTVDGCQELL